MVGGRSRLDKRHLQGFLYSLFLLRQQQQGERGSIHSGWKKTKHPFVYLCSNNSPVLWLVCLYHETTLPSPPVYKEVKGFKRKKKKKRIVSGGSNSQHGSQKMTCRLYDAISASLTLFFKAAC